MEGQEKLGYHKGALESLVSERSELMRLLKIVETLIQYHASNMQQAGVDPKKFLEEVRQEKIKSTQQQTTDGEADLDDFQL